MLVKCTAVPKERTPKRVEITLSKIPPVRKNVVKLQARIVEPVSEPDSESLLYSDSENDLLTDSLAFEEDDNLKGIIPVDEFYGSDNKESFDGDVDALTEIFFEESEESEDEPKFTDSTEISFSEIIADFEELENNLRSQLGDDEPPEETAPVGSYDNEIVQRHFYRDDTGDLYETDSETAEGHEVACYDNSGKLTRACGVIRKSQPAAPADADDADLYSDAVNDMFSDSEN